MATKATYINFHPVIFKNHLYGRLLFWCKRILSK